MTDIYGNLVISCVIKHSWQVTLFTFVVLFVRFLIFWFLCVTYAQLERLCAHSYVTVNVPIYYLITPEILLENTPLNKLSLIIIIIICKKPTWNYLLIQSLFSNLADLIKCYYFNY